MRRYEIKLLAYIAISVTVALLSLLLLFLPVCSISLDTDFYYRLDPSEENLKHINVSPFSVLIGHVDTPVKVLNDKQPTDTDEVIYKHLDIYELSTLKSNGKYENSDGWGTSIGGILGSLILHQLSAYFMVIIPGVVVGLIFLIRGIKKKGKTPINKPRKQRTKAEIYLKKYYYRCKKLCIIPQILLLISTLWFVLGCFVTQQVYRGSFRCMYNVDLAFSIVYLILFISLRILPKVLLDKDVAVIKQLGDDFDSRPLIPALNLRQDSSLEEQLRAAAEKRSAENDIAEKPCDEATVDCPADISEENKVGDTSDNADIGSTKSEH